MSYNITNWTTKRIENLVIPFSALYDASIRKDWIPEQPRLVPHSGHQGIVIEGGCGQMIEGSFADETNSAIRVSNFDMHGEGSGSFWHEVLKSALEKSTGTLEVIRIWEGGDYIDRLRVKDGVLSEEKVEL